MSAPLVPPSQAGPRRRAPGAWRLLGANDPWPIVAVGLVVPTACGGLITLIRRASWTWLDAVWCVGIIASGTALICWRVSRLRRAFTRGREIYGRVTHLAHFEGTGQIPQPQNSLRVVYATEAGEQAALFSLDDDEVARVRPSIGGYVVLIVHPSLRQPLLRDVYLDP